ncbi:MAG: hypothetical protein RLZZ245_3307, partial [Verrucomicrobiota bacterium]
GVVERVGFLERVMLQVLPRVWVEVQFPPGVRP